MLKPGEEVVDVGSGFGGFMFHAQEHYGVKVTAINTTGSQAEHARREIERRRLGNALSMQMHERLPRARPAPVRQGRLHRLPRARRARLARRADPRARGLPQAGRPRPDPLHRPRRPLRHRILHPQVRFSRRLDPEPRRRDRRDGEGRAGGARHREHAPPLRAHARRLGRALRPQLGQDPRARPEALRRALPPHLARVPLRLRRDVPLAGGAHAPVPDRVLQGQRTDQLPDDARLPLRDTPSRPAEASRRRPKRPRRSHG